MLICVDGDVDGDVDGEVVKVLNRLCWSFEWILVE